MTMTVHPAPQGSAEWMADRANRYNAGDAAAMLDCDPNRTRTDLLDALTNGFTPEAGAFKQKIYDKGHEVEAMTRPLAEGMVGEDLYPLVGSIEVEGLARRLGASFDGLTIGRDTGFECKSLNEVLAAVLPAEDDPDANDAANLPKCYRVQMEQQIMVSGAERVLFCAGAFHANGATQSLRACWYRPDADLRLEILAGWKQLEADLATHVPQAKTVTAVAAPVESLPAVMVQMTGALAVTSNLDAFGTALRAFIDKIPAKPTTDQEFADTDAACKALKKAEEALAAEEARALASMADVESMRRIVADLSKLAKSTRLQREKMVEARKLEIRTEEIQRGRQTIADHIGTLNARLGRPYMPAVATDFPGVIKGLRSLDSVRNAIDSEIARAKIAANAEADKIELNLQFLREHAAEHAFLFADTSQLVLRDAEFVAMTARTRIAEHQAAEEKRATELAEKERERIRQEEVARIEREQREAAAQPIAPAPIAQPASAVQAANVVPMGTRAPAKPAAPPSLKLGQVNARIAPLQIDAAGLATLGFPPAATDKSAKLYHEADFPRMVDAMVLHLQQAALPQQAA